jgi:hypothetical protein
LADHDVECKALKHEHNDTVQDAWVRVENAAIEEVSPGPGGEVSPPLPPDRRRQSSVLNAALWR